MKSRTLCLLLIASVAAGSLPAQTQRTGQHMYHQPFKKLKKSRPIPTPYDKLESISALDFDTTKMNRSRQKMVLALYIHYLEKRALLKCKAELLKSIDHPKRKYSYKPPKGVAIILSEKLAKTFGKAPSYFEHKLKQFLNKRNIIVLHNTPPSVDSAIATALDKGLLKLRLRMKLVQKMVQNGTIAQYLPSPLDMSPSYTPEEAKDVRARYNDLITNQLNYHKYVLTRLYALKNDGETEKIKAQLIEDLVDFTTYKKDKAYADFDRFYKIAQARWRDLSSGKLDLEIHLSEQRVAILKERSKTMIKAITAGSLRVDPQEKWVYKEVLPYQEFRSYTKNRHPLHLKEWLKNMDRKVWEQEDGAYGVLSAKSNSKLRAKDRVYDITRLTLKRKKIASIDVVKLYPFTYKTARGYQCYLVFQYPKTFN